LPALLEVNTAGRQSRLDLNLAQGQAIVDLDGFAADSRVSARLRFSNERSDSIREQSTEAME
jgi:hypothetical protein